jgi:hypothetical protein
MSAAGAPPRQDLRPVLVEEIDATLKRLSVHDLDMVLGLVRRLAHR